MSKGAKLKRILVTLCRVLLGAMFIFSGFVKAVDPMGSAIKFGEYFTAFGFDFLHGYEKFFAIALSTGEMVIGLLMLFGIWMRLTASVMAVGMFFFTIFTLCIAITNPVADCGCFGDAWKLTNWESFFKNLLVLLPLSIVVVINAWISMLRRGTWRDFGWVVIFVVTCAGVGVYSLRHLPIMDFLPYKIGVNIPQGMSQGHESEQETRLLYRDMASGEVVEFSISDTTWYDSSRWEYVETIVPVRENTMGRSVADFALLSDGEDVTLQVLEQPGVLFMLCVSNPNDLSPRCLRGLHDAAVEAGKRGYGSIIVTPLNMNGQRQMILGDGVTVDCYNIDDVVLKSMLRAKAGLIVLGDGTIIDKLNCLDIPQDGKFENYPQHRR